MKEKLKKLSDYKWLIPKDARSGMRVDAIFYANKSILDTVEDTAIQQLTNVACLPGIIEPVLGMPDMHWGYGLPMGAIGAFDKEKGVISCGCTGFDINCGIHMLRTNLLADEVKSKLNDLISTLFHTIPCGVGARGKLRLSNKELSKVFTNGVRWAVENGYGIPEDLERIEENGCIKGADPSKISNHAMNRGAPQLGTLGAGNHFLEIQAVDEIYEQEIAKVFGINQKGQITIMIHCGSRGLGHQVATDYLKIHSSAARKYGIRLPDPQLVCAPTTSNEGQDYFSAMKGAANYAFCNRQIIAHWVRESFAQVFKKSWESMEMNTIYDVCHNICKLEEHTINGKKREVYVHRKGATRAFPPGHIDVPIVYRKVGQPVLIAGSMGTASYILIGTDKAMVESFGSSCHGAGRAMSRHAAIKRFRGETVKRELESRGKTVRSTHPKILAEEAPGAYKDVDAVVESVHKAGISKKVARVIPLGIAKG
ncbi:RtcB family protein [candidate division WOR-3 bacterium]|nr:RtcB family protein [candidate division WOR-3 bacterium]